MGLRLSIVGGTLVARSARAFMRPVARRAITTKRTDWAGEARSVCQGATEDKLEALGYALPPASTPKGAYAMYSRAGDTLYLAGHIPVRPDGSICTGVVGKDLKKAQGAAAARFRRYYGGASGTATMVRMALEAESTAVRTRGRS